ncbi:hypothetical protein [Streptomyces sp. NPDC049916]|uniref:hypothetical protein n=1 Tax=Streptomyces sp. NPDC049916 TaxID=3155156 RepID=UPI0034198D5D
MTQRENVPEQTERDERTAGAGHTGVDAAPAHAPATPPPGIGAAAAGAPAPGTASRTAAAAPTTGTPRPGTTPDTAPDTTPDRASAAGAAAVGTAAKHDPETPSRRPSGTAGRATAEKGASGGDPGRSLFSSEEREAFTARIQQAVTGFVEDPRRAVQDADSAFGEVVAGLAAALEERGRRLRTAKGEDGRTDADTEDLRIALQHYRDLTDRLVQL